MDPIISKVETLIQPLLADTDIFLVSVRVKPTNNIKVFLDADSSLNIGTCASINRKLNNIIEEEKLFPDGDYSLEVSSPGIDEPLTSLRQYLKNVNRTVEIVKSDGSILTGLMTAATESSLTIEEKILKKKETKTIEIPMAEVTKTTVQVTF